MARVVALLLTLLLSGIASAQIQSTAETRYIVSGIDGYTVVGDLVLAPGDAKPKLQAVGYVVIDSPASMISVRASDAKRQPVEVRKIEDTKFLVLGQGRLWVDVTAIDFEAQLFEQSQFVIDVGDAPEPDEPDEPDNPTPPDVPDVPEDAFDNIGRRVAAVAMGKPSNGPVFKIYNAWAAKLLTDPALTVTDASTGLVKELATVPGYSEAYSDVRELINADAKARWPLSKGVLADYWTAIAKGFFGAIER